MKNKEISEKQGKWREIKSNKEEEGSNSSEKVKRTTRNTTEKKKKKDGRSSPQTVGRSKINARDKDIGFCLGLVTQNNRTPFVTVKII